jgi:hypothetical protein
MASVRFPADAANRCAPSRVLWTAVAEDPARRLRLTCKSPISGPASQRARGFFLLGRVASPELEGRNPGEAVRGRMGDANPVPEEGWARAS